MYWSFTFDANCLCYEFSDNDERSPKQGKFVLVCASLYMKFKASDWLNRRNCVSKSHTKVVTE